MAPRPTHSLLSNRVPCGTGNLVWPLADHLGTLRDLAEYDDGPSVAEIIKHRTYDSFGNLISETNSAVDELFGFTGRMFDEATGLQNNLHRWYDAKIGQWISEDPVGFAARDMNLRRYVGNSAGWHCRTRLIPTVRGRGGTVGQGLNPTGYVRDRWRVCHWLGQCPDRMSQLGQPGYVFQLAF